MSIRPEPGDRLPRSADHRSDRQRKPYVWVVTRMDAGERRPIVAYFLGVAAIGIPLAVRTFLTDPLPDLGTSLLLATLGLISYHLPVVLSSSIQMNPGYPLLMIALYVHGPAAALLVAVPSSLLHFLTRKHGLTNCLFNAGQFTMATLGSALAGRATGLVQGSPASAASLLGILAMILGGDLVNNAFLAGSMAIQDKRPYWACYWRAFYTLRRTVIAFRVFLSVVAVLLHSYMGNSALILVFIGVFALRGQNKIQHELSLKTQQAETDGLTKAHNVHFLNQWIETQFPSMARHGKPCSIVFLDMDELKNVNDAYGHDAGDAVLVHTASVLLSLARATDRVVRYGGDEFVLLCPDTDLKEASSMAQNAVNLLSDKPCIVGGISIHPGMSVGVASWPKHGETCQDVIRMADRAMYLAKKGGTTIKTADEL